MHPAPSRRRLYGVYPTVSLDYSHRGDAYLALGSYADGANEAGCRFGFTQPVVMSYWPDVRATGS